MKERSYYVLKHLLTCSKVETLSTLSSIFQVSNKTIRNYLDESEELLRKFHIQINRIPGVGISLKGSQEDILNCYNECLTRIGQKPSISPSLRIKLLMFLLLSQEHRITLSQLERQLYVSRSSLRHDLKQVEERFLPFAIQVNLNRKSGLYLVRGEKRTRICLLNLLSELSEEDRQDLRNYFTITNFLKTLEDKELRQYLYSFLNRLARFAGGNISKSDLERTISLLLISFERIRLYHGVLLDPDIESRIKNRKVLDFMRQNSTALEQKFNLFLNDAEIVYLSSFISTILISDYQIALSSAKHPQQINHIIEDFYQCLLRDVVPFDYQYFKENLFLFLETIMRKSDFEFDVYNPNAAVIKNDYQMLFALAAKINPFLKKMTGRVLPEAGIATVTLLLADIYEQFIHQLVCLYLVNNTPLEHNLSLRILNSRFPTLQVVTNEDVAVDFVLSDEVHPKIQAPVFIVPSLIDHAFADLLAKQIDKVISDKKKAFFITD